jgi:hemerythrin-like metal-binding protein
MALLIWSDRLSVGVKAVDDEHRILVDTLNELHTAMLAGKAHSITGKLLQKLVEFAPSHFSAEEEILQAAQFPGLDEHRQRHRDLTRGVESFVHRHQRGDAMLNLHLMNFLRDWLFHHILEEDREYGVWLNQRGIR